MDELKAATMALQESIDKGDCATIQQRINEVLEKAQPIRNSITKGSVQETDDALQTIKSQLQTATEAIVQKCPPQKTNAPKPTNLPKTNAPAQQGGRPKRRKQSRRRV